MTGTLVQVGDAALLLVLLAMTSRQPSNGRYVVLWLLVQLQAVCDWAHSCAYGNAYELHAAAWQGAGCQCSLCIYIVLS